MLALWLVTCHNFDSRQAVLIYVSELGSSIGSMTDHHAVVPLLTTRHKQV